MRISRTILILCAFVAQEAAAQDVLERRLPVVRMGIGVYDVQRGSVTGQRHLEYMLPEEVYAFRPVVGIMTTASNDRYAYAGLTYATDVLRRLEIMLSFAVGYFARGHGIDLGHPIEFRSMAGVGLRVWNGDVIGVEVSHLSHGPLAEHNPGLETVTFWYSFAY